MNWLEGILVSAAGSGLIALIGWLLRTWLLPDPQIARIPSDQFPTLGEVIDFYVQQQHSGQSPQREQVVARHEVIVTTRPTTRDGDDGFLYVFILLFLIAALSYVWREYKVYLLIATGIGTVFGWVSSFYFAAVLAKIPGRLRWEDHALSWGSMLVWALGIFSFMVGVLAPAYSPDAVQWEFALMAAEALQVLGSIFLYVAIVFTATVQFVAGSIYRKALANTLPNRLETWVWQYRGLAIFIIYSTLLLGVPLVSGIVTFLFPVGPLST